MSGQDVHHALAVVVGLAAVVVLVLTAARAWLGRPGRLAVDRAILAALVIALVAVGSGGVVFAIGSPPHDPLHFVYAVAILAVLPIARFWPGFAHRRSAALAIAAVVLVGLVVRLAQTG